MTDGPPSLQKIMETLGIPSGSTRDVSSLLPFSSGDVTAGTETELQAAVVGKRCDVDLPLTIEQSNYYQNIVRRAASGDAPRKAIVHLERLLAANTGEVWENSWVRMRLSALSPLAREVLQRDLLADKSDRTAGQRSDVHKFIWRRNEREQLRIPGRGGNQ